MKHAYTEEQLIRFMYKECDIFEKLEIEFAMEDDSTLMNSYQKLLHGIQALPGVKFGPSKSTINNILKYSLEASEAHF
ncbi:MAG: hypothetical protein IPM42_13665 [Saprospiraceae bacterium]|nr:hypothetical protein [Saprospiraceae bacterium]